MQTKKQYSTVLKDNLSETEKKIQEAKIAIIAFRSHLCSSKFHKDTTIQVSDVHNWLDAIVKQLEFPND